MVVGLVAVISISSDSSLEKSSVATESSLSLLRSRKPSSVEIEMYYMVPQLLNIESISSLDELSRCHFSDRAESC